MLRDSQQPRLAGRFRRNLPHFHPATVLKCASDAGFIERHGPTFPLDRQVVFARRAFLRESFGGSGLGTSRSRSGCWFLSSPIGE